MLILAAEGAPKERALVSRVEPEYPEMLLRKRIGGNVRLELIITEKGSVESVTVLGGNPILAEAAAKAAKQWVFAPWPSVTRLQLEIPFAPTR